MKTEEQLINDLFRAARTQAPLCTYDEVAASFSASVAAAPAAQASIQQLARQFLLNNISLNSLLLLVVAGGALLLVLEQPGAPMEPTAEAARSPQVTGLRPTPPPAKARPLTRFQQPPLAIKAKQAKAKTILPSPIHSKTPEDLLQLPIEGSTKPGAALPSTPLRQYPISITKATAATTDSIPDKTSKQPGLVEVNGQLFDDQQLRMADRDREVSLVLLKTYTRDATLEFFAMLRSYGFVIKKERYRFRKGQINRFFMHLTHDQGLDFKLRGTHFNRLDFVLHFDELDQLKGFSYYFDGEKKPEKITSLKARGAVSYRHDY